MSIAPSLRVSLLVFAGFLLAVDSVNACVCVPKQYKSLAEAVDSATMGPAVVFLGMAESRAPEDAPEGDDDIFFFRVIEVFKGEKEGRKAVHTGVGRKMVSSCGYHFQIGRAYLVFASKYENDLVTGVCSLTTPAERADGMLRHLRGEPPKPEDLLSMDEHVALRWKQTTGSICGKVSRADGRKVTSVNINLIDKDGEVDSYPDWFTRTADGSYCVPGLEPRQYRVTATSAEEEHGLFWKAVFGGSSVGDSPPLHVIAGSNIKNIDLQLSSEPMISVKGHLLAGTKPLFELAKTEYVSFDSVPGDPFPFSLTVTVDQRGSFSAKLPVGKYFSRIYIEHSGAAWVAEDVEVSITPETTQIVVTLKSQPIEPPL